MKKNFFITGGTGSFSRNFIKFILKKKAAKKIVIYSRDEFKQMQLREIPEIKNNLDIFRFFIGDVRDKDRLKFALTTNIDVVVHTAALKQVPASEYNPFETVKTNILGAQNLIDSCLEKNIPKIIALSTDKAAAPTNLYGATKLTSDKLFTSANYYKGKKKSIFSVVRYGNVFGSRGSAIPVFYKQQKNQNYFTVTSKEMTRFSITLDESVKFVIKCINIMKGGEIFVPKIPSYKITDIIKAFNPKMKIKIIGVRPGEKIHEEMITLSDSINTSEYKDYFIIHPSYKNGIKNKFPYSYNSQDNKYFLSVNQIKNLIKKNIKNFY